MTNSFSITTQAYQGPLEMLLDLIEERKLSISEVSLSEVTDAYLAHVEKLPELPLGETAQFILIASTLLLIKSRTLLPSLELSDDERESVDELERRLARLRIFRGASKLLRKEWGRAPLRLAVRAPQRPIIFTPAESSIAATLAAMQRLLNTLPKPREIIEATVAPVLALEEVIENLRARISSAFRTSFQELTRSKDRHETIVYFLGVLELVSSGSASVTQEKLFDDIVIESDAIERPSYGT